MANVWRGGEGGGGSPAASPVPVPVPVPVPDRSAGYGKWNPTLGQLRNLTPWGQYSSWGKRRTRSYSIRAPPPSNTRSGCLPSTSGQKCRRRALKSDVPHFCTWSQKMSRTSSSSSSSSFPFLLPPDLRRGGSSRRRRTASASAHSAVAVIGTREGREGGRRSSRGSSPPPPPPPRRRRWRRWRIRRAVEAVVPAAANPRSAASASLGHGARADPDPDPDPHLHPHPYHLSRLRAAGRKGLGAVMSWQGGGRRGGGEERGGISSPRGARGERLGDDDSAVGGRPCGGPSARKGVACEPAAGSRQPAQRKGGGGV